MNEFNVELLKELMRINGDNGSQLAKKLGVTRACVSRILRGDRKTPDTKILLGLPRIYPGYSVEDFFMSKPSPKGDTGRATTSNLPKSA